MKPGLEPLEQLVVELLRDAASRQHGSPSELLAARFRKERLKPRQQKRVKELFHAIIAHERLIEHAFEVATPSGSVHKALRAPLQVMIAKVLQGDLGVAGARRQIEWVDWKRVASLQSELKAGGDPVQQTEILGGLPAWLAEQLVREFGDAAPALAESLGQRAPVFIRTNLLSCTREELSRRLAEEGIETRETPWSPWGLEVVTAARLFATSAYREGWFEMQDVASQLVALVTAPPPRGVVLDACAGAGGKTLALAAMLENRGEILAADSDARRLGDLRTRARRAGAHNVTSQRVGDDEWPERVADFAARADRILVDVPCSGVGSLRRHPELRWRLDQEVVARLAPVQRGLLDRAVRALKPNARAIYATCTVLREENEAIVESVVDAHEGIEVMPVVEILGGDVGRPIADATGRFLRMAPHSHGTDGFFAAVLRRVPS